MQVKLIQQKNELHFTLFPEAHDPSAGTGQLDRGIHLLDNRFRFILPFETEVHPDLLAMTALMVTLPFTGTRFTAPRPVSAAFADAVYQAFDIEVGPVNSQLASRRPGRRPGLAFSAGIDSLASMLLMPEDSALVFLERIPHPRVTTRPEFDTYTAAAALHACGILEAEGRPVFRVQTDHEYCLGPFPDYATWLGTSTQLMLLADALELDSAWNGNVFGSTYWADWQGLKFFSWAGMGHDPQKYPWEYVMSAVGLPLARPVGGISELGTTTIVNASPYAQLATSCANGPDGQPCMYCKKCLRKALIEPALAKQALPRTFWRPFAANPEVHNLFADGTTIDHIFMYCFQNLPPIPEPYFARVQRSIQAVSPDVSFLERWYPVSIEHIPEQYRDDFRRRVSQYLDTCTPEEVARIEAWEPVMMKLLPPTPAELFDRWMVSKARGAVRRAKRIFRKTGMSGRILSPGTE